MEEFWSEFVAIWFSLFEHEATRGIMYAGLGVVFSWPAYGVLILLRKLPRSLIEGKLTIVMGLFGLILGCTIGALGMADQSHAIQVGVQAGLTAGLYVKK